MHTDTMPNKLRLRNGRLEMIDGSDPSAYLQDYPGLPDGSDVVLMRRDKAVQLLKDATAYRMSLDSRFALCA